MIRARLSALKNLPPWQKTLFILAFAQFISSLGFSNIFPFLPFYIQELGAKTAFSVEFWVGMVFSAQAATMMIASPIWGAVADRYGRKLMIERAMFGGALVFLLMGFARSAEELVLLRVVQGMITGTVSAINAMVAATAPREKTGYAMGVVQVSRWTGISIGPLMGGFTADLVGFRATFAVTAGLLALAGALVWLGVQETFVRSPQVTVGRNSFMSEWRSILRASGVSLTYAVRFLSWLGQTMFLPLIPLFAQSLLPETARVSSFTGLVVGLGSAAGTVSALYLGRLGDRLGHRRILIASIFITALFYFAQSFTGRAWQFLVVQALAGAAAGGMVPALGALLANYTHPGEEGAAYGLDNSIVAAARAVAPLIGTWIAVTFSLRSTFAVAGLVLALTAALALWRLPEPGTAPQPTPASP